jgi:hypothetical protein
MPRAKESVARTRFEGVSPIPSRITAKRGWGSRFGNEWGLALPMPHGNVAAVFVDKRLLSGNYKTVMQVFGKTSIAGYVVSCEGTEWVIECEPTEENRCGLIIYRKTRRKALMAGSIAIKKNGLWTFTAETLYRNITNRKHFTAGVDGGVRGGTGQRTEVEGGGHVAIHW